MHDTPTTIPGTTYRLLETIPYPRAQRPGNLVDATGTRLHGAYERKVAGGYRSALINHGSVFHRYTHARPSPAAVPGARHSYANIVLYGGRSWTVPDASARPMTNYPATEYPYQCRCPLWDSHFVTERLLAGVKPAGLINGTPDQVAAWCAEAEAAGLVTRTLASWLLGNGQTNTVAVIAQPGPVLIGTEHQTLDGCYRGLLPDDLLDDLLDELEGLTGEDLLCRDLANPHDARDLIITGHAFGYPPMTTVACIFGTHGW